MKIISVVGARPNFMKVAPLVHVINEYNNKSTNKVEHLLIHTGQHYDDRMSKSFFEALNIPPADINLGIGSGTHAEQVGNSMIALERVFIQKNPDWVVIYGDVNATMAATIAAKKLHIKVCHIEAGLRSGDERMPEEINRLVTDRLCDLLLTPDKISNKNLLKEGIPKERIKFVGNIMIDTLESNRKKASTLEFSSIVMQNLLDSKMIKVDLNIDDFVIFTLHRPSNVDEKPVLEPIIRFLLDEVSPIMPVIWPIHPRTQKQLKVFNLWDEVLDSKKIILLHPIGYHEMLKLNMSAKIMLTDSGGLQEECTVLGTPCLTMRWNTERPITLRELGGASVLVGNNIDRIRYEFHQTLALGRKPVIPKYWDGHTAKRCFKTIMDFSKSQPSPRI